MGTPKIAGSSPHIQNLPAFHLPARLQSPPKPMVKNRLATRIRLWRPVPMHSLRMCFLFLRVPCVRVSLFVRVSFSFAFLACVFPFSYAFLACVFSFVCTDRTNACDHACGLMWSLLNSLIAGAQRPDFFYFSFPFFLSIFFSFPFILPTVGYQRPGFLFQLYYQRLLWPGILFPFFFS